MNSQEVYLTKRIIVRATSKGMKVASKETMDIMGHNVIAQDDWVVRKYKDGSIEPITKIPSPSNHGPLTLD